MIASAILHFSIHWRWVLKVARKLIGELPQSGENLARQGSPLQ
jgi:hypothetical protein